MFENDFDNCDYRDDHLAEYTKEEWEQIIADNLAWLGQRMTRKRYPWRYGDKGKVLPGSKQKKKVVESLREHRRMSKSERLAYYVEYAKTHDTIEEAFTRS